jgi:hypothetical protein
MRGSNSFCCIDIWSKSEKQQLVESRCEGWYRQGKPRKGINTDHSINSGVDIFLKNRTKIPRHPHIKQLIVKKPLQEHSSMQRHIDILIAQLKVAKSDNSEMQVLHPHSPSSNNNN